MRENIGSLMGNTETEQKGALELLNKPQLTT